MEQFALTVLSSAGVSAALTAVLVWLAKTWLSDRIQASIRHEYDAKLATLQAQMKAEHDAQLETHKAQLKAQADVELERLRASLSTAAAEHNLKFARLHDKRMEVIAQTYSGLRRLHTCVIDYVKIFEMSGSPSREARRDRTIEAWDAFWPNFTQHQIFLPAHIAEEIEKSGTHLLQMTNQFTIFVDMRGNNPDVEKWTKITEQLDKEFSASLRDLERELRSAMGDVQV